MNYTVPEKPGFLGAMQWKAILTGWLIMIAAEFLSTEFMAYRFQKLGMEFSQSVQFGQIAGLPIYLPFCWLKWVVAYHKWLFHNVPPYSSTIVISAVVGTIGIIIGATNGNTSFNRRAKQLGENAEDIYGSAKWLDKKGIDAAGLLRKQRGLLIGGWQESRTAPIRYLYDDTDRHVLLVAPTGTGKTYSIGIPNAMLWQGSQIVIDIKEEIYRATAGIRQKQGHLCLKFSPLEPEGSLRINPLAWIRFETKKEASDVQKFSQEIANPGNEGSDATHWNDISMSLLDGVILHEAYKCKLRYGRTVTIHDLSESLSPYDESLPKEDRDKAFLNYLAQMSAYIHDPEGRFNWKDAKGNPTRTHPIVREKAMEALQRHIEEASGALSTAKKRFRLYSDPLIQQVTSECDLDIDDLVDYEKPVSLYLVLPPSEKRRLAPLVRILLLMILARLTEKQVARRHKLLILADEFPSLGYVRPMEDALSYIRGYGIRCLLIVQNTSQISSVQRYGPDNEIIPNCQIKIFNTIGDFKTAEITSKEIGPRTIQHAAINFGHKKNKTTGRVEAQSAHVQNTKRDLVSADELMRLDLPEKDGDRVVKPGECVIILFGSMPIKGVQTFCFFDPKMSEWMKIKPIDQSRALVKQAEYLAEAS